MPKVERIVTPASYSEVASALASAGAPNENAVKLLAAHSAVETGSWMRMSNYNLGNYTVWNQALEAWYIAGSNPRPFKAFQSLKEGADWYVQKIDSQGLLRYAVSGDVTGYVNCLKSIGYAIPVQEANTPAGKQLYLEYERNMKERVAAFGGTAPLDLPIPNLDYPATSESLWTIHDAGGPRPEYLLPVLYCISGLRPQYDQGVSFGLSSTSLEELTRLGIDYNAYTKWTASSQLDRVIKQHLMLFSATGAPIRSGIRCYVSFIIPSSLPANALTLDHVLSYSSDAFYHDHAGLDVNGDGVITVGDLAYAVHASFKTQAVQSALSKAYDIRPIEKPHDPIYGEDYPTPYLSGAYGALAFETSAILARGLARIFQSRK